MTGFDSPALNTLWVDKNLKYHGLIQAFSRTNRILNSVKTFGNIVCFRDLKKSTDDAIALFGDKDAKSTVLLKTYDDYYNGYEEHGKYNPGYKELVENLTTSYPLGQEITGENSQKEFIKLYGAILKVKNILNSFDDFEGNEILNDRDFQDYRDQYIDLYTDITEANLKEGERENINEDIVFELELIRQEDINIDHILILVENYRKSNCSDKSIVSTIDRAIGSSIELHSKKELIKKFIERINAESHIDNDWKKFIIKQKEQALSEIIEKENLKPDETREFVPGSFRDGFLKTTGTGIDKILPPESRFDKKNKRTLKKRQVIRKLQAFFEKFLGLANNRDY